MTFALGLASVFMLNGSLQFSDEVFVNLPEINNEIILVHPKLASEIPLEKSSVIACSRGKLIKIEENNSDHK